MVNPASNISKMRYTAIRVPRMIGSPSMTCGSEMTKLFVSSKGIPSLYPKNVSVTTDSLIPTAFDNRQSTFDNSLRCR